MKNSLEVSASTQGQPEVDTLVEKRKYANQLLLRAKHIEEVEDDDDESAVERITNFYNDVIDSFTTLIATAGNLAIPEDYSGLCQAAKLMHGYQCDADDPEEATKFAILAVDAKRKQIDLLGDSATQKGHIVLLELMAAALWFTDDKLREYLREYKTQLYKASDWNPPFDSVMLKALISPFLEIVHTKNDQECVQLLLKDTVGFLRSFIDNHKNEIDLKHYNLLISCLEHSQSIVPSEQIEICNSLLDTMLERVRFMIARNMSYHPFISKGDEVERKIINVCAQLADGGESLLKKLKDTIDEIFTIDQDEKEYLNNRIQYHHVLIRAKEKKADLLRQSNPQQAFVLYQEALEARAIHRSLERRARDDCKHEFTGNAKNLFYAYSNQAQLAEQLNHDTTVELFDAAMQMLLEYLKLRSKWLVCDREYREFHQCFSHQQQCFDRVRADKLVQHYKACLRLIVPLYKNSHGKTVNLGCFSSARDIQAWFTTIKTMISMILNVYQQRLGYQSSHPGCRFYRALIELLSQPTPESFLLLRDTLITICQLESENSGSQLVFIKEAKAILSAFLPAAHRSCDSNEGTMVALLQQEPCQRLLNDIVEKLTTMLPPDSLQGILEQHSSVQLGLYHRICQQDVEIAALKEQIALLVRQQNVANAATHHRFFNQGDVPEQKPVEKREREEDDTVVDESEAAKKMKPQSLPNI